MSEIDVAIVGAGPYGLAAASHVGKLGLSMAVMGAPMCFWQHCMPAGMLLRSPNVASDIADPDNSFGLAAYGAARGEPVPSPLPIDRFIDYGLWVQRQVAPVVDSPVERIDHHRGRFRLTLADGDAITAAQVVVAAGIALSPRDRIRSVLQNSQATSDHSISRCSQGDRRACGCRPERSSGGHSSRGWVRPRCLPVHSTRSSSAVNPGFTNLTLTRLCLRLRKSGRRA
jgi:glycine/D-amino acid oxidase-like deaminating enzyme